MGVSGQIKSERVECVKCNNGAHMSHDACSTISLIRNGKYITLCTRIVTATYKYIYSYAPYHLVSNLTTDNVIMHVTCRSCRDIECLYTCRADHWLTTSEIVLHGWRCDKDVHHSFDRISPLPRRSRRHEVKEEQLYLYVVTGYRGFNWCFSGEGEDG
jgi:hypothetical protein